MLAIKQNKMEGQTIEEKAIMRADEKEALYILSRMRYFASLLRRNRTEYNSHKLEFWENKADVLLHHLDVPLSKLKPTRNFKSLLEQYKEGQFYEK